MGGQSQRVADCLSLRIPLEPAMGTIEGRRANRPQPRQQPAKIEEKRAQLVRQPGVAQVFGQVAERVRAITTFERVDRGKGCGRPVRGACVGWRTRWLALSAH